jgi:hypothetical protein
LSGASSGRHDATPIFQFSNESLVAAVRNSTHREKLGIDDSLFSQSPPVEAKLKAAAAAPIK